MAGMVSIGVIVPNLIVGTLVICMGFLVVWRRKALNEFVYDSQKKLLGPRVARASAGRQTPFMMGLVGAFIVIIGIAMVTLGIVGIVQRLSP